MKPQEGAVKGRDRRPRLLAAIFISCLVAAFMFSCKQSPPQKTGPESAGPSQPVAVSLHKKYPRIPPDFRKTFLEGPNDLAKYSAILFDRNVDQMSKMQVCNYIAMLDDKKAAFEALEAHIRMNMPVGGAVPSSAGYALLAIGHLNTQQALPYLQDFRKTLTGRNDPRGALRVHSIAALVNFTIEEEAIVEILKKHALSDRTFMTGLVAIDTLARIGSEESADALVGLWEDAAEESLLGIKVKAAEEGVKARIVEGVSRCPNMNNLNALVRICAKEPTDANFGPAIMMHKAVAERALLVSTPSIDFEGMGKEQIKTLLLESLKTITSRDDVSAQMLDVAQFVKKTIEDA
jgi:hypothetical protein